MPRTRKTVVDLGSTYFKQVFGTETQIALEKETKMPGIVVSLKGVATGFEPLPDGNYDAKFTSFKNGVTKSAGDPKIDFEFTVTSPDEFEGKKAFMTQSIILSPPEKNNLHFLKQVLVHLGADPDDLESEELNVDEVLRELRGNDVKLKLGHRDVTEGGVTKTYQTTQTASSDSWS